MWAPPPGRKILGVKGLRGTEKLCEGLAATSADVISGVLFLAEEQGLGLLVTELFSQVKTKVAGRRFVLFRLPPAPSISMLISMFYPFWLVGIVMEIISQVSRQDFANIEIGGLGGSPTHRRFQGASALLRCGFARPCFHLRK